MHILQPLHLGRQCLDERSIPAANHSVIRQLPSGAGIDDHRKARERRRKVRHAVVWIVFFALKPGIHVPLRRIDVDRRAHADDAEI